MNDIVKAAVADLAAGLSPAPADIEYAFNEILSGRVDPILISALLMGLRVKGESVEDVTSAASVMRKHARKVQAPEGAVDTCGTGGLPWTTLNTSTASAIVAASAGAVITKHGNRSTPPKTGSADVLEALGVNLNVTDAQFANCLSEAGVGFMFAQAHHSAMRYVAPVRKALGIRTIFNLLGPLSNPAGAKKQVLGVFSKDWVEPIAHVLKNLGAQKAWVVHGLDGLDEISVSSETFVAEVSPSGIETFTLSPEDAGLQRHALEDLKGGAPDFNAEAIKGLLEGAKTPFRDIVALNAAAALVVAEKTEDLKTGVQQCLAAIDSGAAKSTLAHLITSSNEASL